MKIITVKKKNGICIFLNDCLFNDIDMRDKKLCKIFELFSLNFLLVKCCCYIDDGEIDLKKLESLLETKVSVLFAKKAMLSKKKFSKIQVECKEKCLTKIIEIFLKYDLSMEAECYIDQKNTILEFVINDNDGTSIIFNPKYFNVEEIKQQINEILFHN